ncbi:MAG: FAD:protein FMN transferase [Dehalococcoidia bacterium]
MVTNAVPGGAGQGVEFTDSFRAMDTEIDVTVMADRPPIEAFLSIRVLFEQQEARFSRFRPGSLVSRLNRGEVVTDPWLADACQLAVAAHAATGGLFNPLVLEALLAAGYDRTFAEVSGGMPVLAPAPDPALAIAIEGETVRLSRGGLDLGGIVKGWTVDLAVELVARDVAGVLVNAGGDLRAAGSSDAGEGWYVEVDAPDGTIAWAGMLTGAVATSTTAKRRWRTDTGGVAHHLIDPRTGIPADTPFVQVSAWAAEARVAETWAKAVLIGGDATATAASRAGVSILAFDSAGSRTAAGPAFA